MKINYDSEVDVLYFQLLDAAVTTKRLTEDIAIDYDSDGQLAGVELLNGCQFVSYDEGADTLYINFNQYRIATDSELTDDDVIIRYSGDELIGFTVLYASKRPLTQRS